jgi:rhodanese-related sulfurtransferase/DNA-binding MarR family transcriptional regulator
VSREKKDALFDGFAAVAKALASGRRAEILDVLGQGRRSVEEIAKEIDQSTANTSRHLRLMAQAGLLRSERRGTQVFYRHSSNRVHALWRELRDLAAEQSAEVARLAEAYLGDRKGLEPVPQEELARRIKRGDVVVIDVRSAVEYANGHIPGARSIPHEELVKRLRSLPTDTEIVAYCRGPYCVFADDAVRTLRSKGLFAHRLEDGFPEWADAGRPVATGAF